MAQPRGLRLFLGADRAAKRARLDAISQALRIGPLDRHDVIAGDAAWSAAALAGLVRQHPASGSSTLIVVDDAHRLDAASADALAQAAESAQEFACVVLLADVDLPAKHALTAVKSRAAVEWFELGSPDAGGAKEAFALAEAVARRDAGAAVRVVHEQLAYGKDVIELIGLLVWQLQRWLTVRHLLDAGRSPERISALTKIQPWQLGRISSELRGRSSEWLVRMLKRCEELDRGVKSSRLIPKAALDALVVELCLEERGVTSSARTKR